MSKQDARNRQRTSDDKAARSAEAWCCKICQAPDGTPFRNFGDRRACHKCGLAKGSSFLRKADETPKRPPSSNMAERQAKQRLQSKDSEIARLRKELEAADAVKAERAKAARQKAATDKFEKEESEEVARLKKRVAQLEQAIPADTMDVDSMAAADGKPPRELSQRATKARQLVCAYKAMAAEVRETLCAKDGGYDAALAAAEAEYAAATDACRKAMPVDEQQADKERYIKRIEAAVQKATAEDAELKEKLAALQKEADAASSRKAKLQAALDAGRQELLDIKAQILDRERTATANLVPAASSAVVVSEEECAAINTLVEVLGNDTVQSTLVTAGLPEGTQAAAHRALTLLNRRSTAGGGAPSASAQAAEDAPILSDQEVSELERQTMAAKRASEEAAERLDQAKKSRAARSLQS